MLMQSEYTTTIILDEEDLDAIAAWYGKQTVTPQEIKDYLHQAAEDQLARDVEALAASLS